MFRHCVARHNQEETQPDAPDKPPSYMLAILVTVSFSLVFIVMLVSFPLLEKLNSGMADRMTLGMGCRDRVLYVSSQRSSMASYQKKDHDRYQIPIEQAMQLVIEKQGAVLGTASQEP